MQDSDNSVRHLVSFSAHCSTENMQEIENICSMLKFWHFYYEIILTDHFIICLEIIQMDEC